MERLRLSARSRCRLGAERGARRGRGPRALPARRRAPRAGQRRAHPLVGARARLRAHRGRGRARALPPQRAHADARRAAARARPAVRRARRRRARLGRRRRPRARAQPQPAARPRSSSTSASSASRPGSRPRSSTPSPGRSPTPGRACGRPPSPPCCSRRRSPSLLVSAAMWLSGDGIEPRKLGADGRDGHRRRGDQREPRPRGRRPSSAPTRAARPAAGAGAGGLPRLPRLHLASSRQRTNLEFLHEASRALTGAPRATWRRASPGMLAMALETFRGEVAEVCLLPAGEDGNGAADHRRARRAPRDHAAARRQRRQASSPS